MLRYFLNITFDGTDFHGWQIQPNSDTVQETLQLALKKIIGEPTEIIGAGRTDTGVHAKCMIAHVDLNEVDDQNLFIHKMNSVLPDSIAINSIVPVRSDAHARFDAISRTYEYHIHRKKDPFLLNRSYYFNRPLDLGLMNKAANELYNFRDFTSFSKLHTDTKTNDCELLNANWQKNGEQLIFTVTANRFLRNMVRAIVGTLLEVGLEKITIEEFRRIIEMKDRGKAGFSVPAHGLYLSDIKYKEDIYE